jgi:hypothetical protein
MTNDELTPAPRARWLVLAGYSLLVARTQLLWLSFAPVTTQARGWQRGPLVPCVTSATSALSLRFLEK